MIIADFVKDPGDRLVGFRVTGHAGYADFGEDVCCASVSSAVMMAANTVTDAFRIKADVAVDENDFRLTLGEDPQGNGDKVLLGLMTHLYLIGEEFPGRIKVNVSEG
ncbi:MAG: ribosomal-processing cysteine protease Prp [Ruminococcus sp.]|nr:ribosomal-processing cysteine protease Prp [Ruminococcus sp.]